ncbi:MAG TPA: TonB family protein [Gemmatimonadaceae bacterium]|nr:TonB family protein [Gemmatimonadaceae bacterium]
MSTRRPARARIGGPLGVSALVHVGVLAAAAVLARPEPPLVLPPVYRVQLFAAPPGPRQIGVVQPPPPAAPEPAAEPAPATPPPAPEVQERAMPSPTKPADPPKRPQQQATPNTATTRTQPSAGSEKAPPEAKPDTKAAEKSNAQSTSRTPSRAPTAGGGPQGGRGTDVANVNTPGVDFPYPSYLQNIVRQIAVRFTPAPGSAYTAQVRFTIRRDGSVAGITVVQGSGDYEFDTDARAAVEAAGRSGAFGALPSGFRDDALTVYFAFDPKVIR